MADIRKLITVLAPVVAGLVAQVHWRTAVVMLVVWYLLWPIWLAAEADILAADAKRGKASK